MLNKTLKKQGDVTASEPEQKQKSPARLLLAGGLIVFGLLLVMSGIRGVISDTDVLKAPNGNVRIERVIAPEDRQRGLSGRDYLDAKSGMLFVFDDAAASHCLWMKDMKISIDMVWMDEQKKVLNVEDNVSPETYPQAFCPDGTALYALELAAGQASQLGIKTGETLRF